MGSRAWVVLAFVDGWNPDDESPAAVDAVRAELRRRGASLLVFSERGVHRLDPERGLTRAGGLEDRSRLAAAEGLRRLPIGPALFLVGESGAAEVTCEDALSPRELLATLAAALSSEAPAFTRGAPGSRRMSHREWVAMSLALGFALAGLEGGPDVARSARGPAVSAFHKVS